MVLSAYRLSLRIPLKNLERKQDIPQKKLLDVAKVSQLLEVLPPNTDVNTITLSNQPAGGDIKPLKDIGAFKVSQIGLRYSWNAQYMIPHAYKCSAMAILYS
jgi:hypothetical protein